MANFDFTSKCAHPRICQRLMEDFVNSASDLTYEDDCTPIKVVEKEDGEYSLVLGEPNFITCYTPIKVRKGSNKRGSSYTVLRECEDEPVYIYYRLDYHTPKDCGHREFGRNIHLRAPFTKGFSSVTLMLLHELGHQETLNEVPAYYDRAKAIKSIQKMSNKTACHQRYFSLPDEYLATSWAIEWLTKKENRKIAKNFEKAFFKAWRG